LRAEHGDAVSQKHRLVDAVGDAPLYRRSYACIRIER
jgi:hypothetical protein